MNEFDKWVKTGVVADGANESNAPERCFAAGLRCAADMFKDYSVGRDTIIKRVEAEATRIESEGRVG